MTGTCPDCPDIFMTGTIWISKKQIQKVVSLELIHSEDREEKIYNVSFMVLHWIPQIHRKVTKDKRVITDFRHLNIRIVKNNLAYPLLKDTFSVLGGSRCEVLSVLDFKNAFHSLKLSENSKGYGGLLLYFGTTLYLY